MTLPFYPLRKRLLAAGERIFKTDIRYLIRGGVWSTAAQIIVSLSAFGLSIAFSRLLTKDAYGTYKFVLAIVSVLGAFSLNGLSGAVFQSAARGFDGDLPRSFWLNLRYSAFVFLGAFVVGAYYLVHGNTVIGTGVLIAGCLAPLLASANLYTAFLAGKKDFARQSLYGGMLGTLVPALVLLATVNVAPNPVVLLAVYFLSNSAIGVFFHYRTLRAYRSIAEHQDPALLSYAVKMSGLGLVAGIADNVGQILLFHYVGAAELAIYTFAIGILDQSKGPLKTLDAMIQARFVGRSDRDIASGMRSKYLWLLLFSLVVIAVYVPLAPYLYRFLFPAYLSAVPYSQVYALSLLSLAFSPAGSYLAAKRKVRSQYVVTITMGVIQTVAIAIGVIGWGLWGLIIARVMIRLLGGSLTHLLYSLSSSRT